MMTKQVQDGVKSGFQVGWRRKYFVGEPLEIGNAVQFLFDDFVVEDRYGLKRVIGPVEKYPGNPLDTGPDLPWESQRPTLAPVIYDPLEKRYKTWYITLRWQEGVESGYSYSTCYAESADGLAWTKPLFDFFASAPIPVAEQRFFSVPGSVGNGKSCSGRADCGEHRRTNLVLHKEKGCAVLCGVSLDPEAPDPLRRFSALAKMVPPGENDRCIVLMHSPDGRKWTMDPDPVLFRGASDSSFSLVRNPELDCWMIYRRPSTRALKKEGFYAEANDKRHVSVCLSRDMKTWTHPAALAMPDEIDPSDIDDVTVIRQNGLFLGFIGLMDNNSRDVPKRTEMMWSRDGFAWERLPDRPAFIANGAPGEWDEGSISFGSAVPDGDHCRIYYIGVNVPQFEKRLPHVSGTGLASVGRDRWIGQQAGAAGGYLLTRRFILAGDRLAVNCRSRVNRPPAGDPGGLLKAELLKQPDDHSPAGAWPGFAMENCDPATLGDETARVLTWNGSPDLSALRGKPVYIRFFLRNATLYTFQVAEQGR